MKIGLLREGKNPPDKRVPFSPNQCKDILQVYPQITLYAQPSTIRCFSDSDYQENGVIIQEDLSVCDVLLGVKEVPINMLIDNKIFFFFSHTIKKQPYNQELLKAVINKKIQLVDYETLIYPNKKRVLGFGRYAGIVGAYNTFLAYGKKTHNYDLEFPHFLDNKQQLEKELLKVQLPSNFKIILTGSGRVSQGVQEILDVLNIKKISKKDFVSQKYSYPTYVQLLPSDYYMPNGDVLFIKQDFYQYPQKYSSCLLSYALHANMLITGHYHASNNPTLLSKEDLQNPLLKLAVIGDVSCDILEPIASTIRPSTIQDPIYGYNPHSGLEDDYDREGVITVMAVDNLPCSLPKDASIDFGSIFIKKVLPDLMGDLEMVNKGTITKNGKLTSQFKYLTDYIT